MTGVVAPRELREDIQGLRAVAVLLVIGYHLSPSRIAGGYVGVDVFFVVSGFLITSHLVREAEATSKVSLLGFWARRARRLLPASLLVLVACTALTWAYLPRSLWEQTLHQVVMSALYVQNWALAAQAIDYSAMGSDPSLVQHYWSLSVEEQFYLAWPLLVVAALVLLRRRPGWSLRGLLLVVLGAVSAASLACSVWLTSVNPSQAYFVTPTRAWEFGAGALLALLGPSAGRRVSASRATKPVVGWIGLGGILWSALVLSDATPFPGAIAAVPVLATVAVLWAGTDRSRASVSGPLSFRPVTFLGDISYSMYLWHWPLVVIGPYVTGAALRATDKVVILLLTIALSWACTRWFEDPVRRSGWLSAPRRVYPVVAVVMSVVVALALGTQNYLEKANRDAAAATEEALVSGDPCLGPSIFDHVDTCGPVVGDGNPPLNPAAVANQNLESTYPDCMSSLDDDEILTCELGATADVRRTVAVVGDSHGTSWFSAFDTLAAERSWRVVTYTRASCPFTDARRTLADEPKGRYQVCRASNAEVERRLVDDPEIDTVFVSAFSSAYGWQEAPGTALADPPIDGFRAVWARLVEAGKQVVVLRDVPAVKDRIETPICLERSGLDAVACATTRADGLQPDVQAEAVTGADGVSLIDLTERLCDAERCYGVVGDVIVYRDSSHLSAEYSTLLAPYVGRAFDEVDAAREAFE